MHSNVRFMLDKTVVSVPFGNGAFPFYSNTNNSIHSFINLIYSL